MFYIIITIIFWSSSFVATKILLNFISPYTIAFERFFLAYLIFLIINHKIEHYDKKDFYYLVGASLTGVTFYFLFENEALVYTSPTNASLIINSVPVFTTILYDLKNMKLPDKVEYMGMGIAFLGTAVIILNGRFILKFNPLGDILMILASLSWAFYTVFIDKLLVKHSYITLLRDIFLMGSIFLLPFSYSYILYDGLSWLLYPEAFFSFIFLSIFASSLGYFFWNRGIKEIDPKIVTNFIYFMPLITTVEDIIIIKSKVNLFHLIGGTMILLGVILIDRRVKNEKNLS